ncbi:LLM class flavin-dependent oxidoreductase OS=Streptomyces rimosus subsp. rimosus (strain ATCC/ DSM 40260 / JCM 4667 / NRRL 2234) OX=1265868 GN=SRIM_040690 PE=4 SV=1 [Streptomyces rimosus subsp. rimosus]
MPRWPTASTSTTALGIEHFVLSGYPHLEEAYWFGEGVRPRAGSAGLWRWPGEGEPAEAAEAQVPFAGRG